MRNGPIDKRKQKITAKDDLGDFLKSKQWHSGNHADGFESKALLRAAKRLFLCQLSSLLKYLKVCGRKNIKV